MGGVCEDFKDPLDLAVCDEEEELFQIAKALPSGTVDLLVGAHTHNILAHYVNGVPVIESGAYGSMFGLAYIHYSKSRGRVTRVSIEGPVPICHYHFADRAGCLLLESPPSGGQVPARFLGQEVVPVPFVDSLLTEQQKEVLQLARSELGPEVVRDLVSEKGRDNPMGLLVTHTLLEDFPDASVALFNESGIRSSLLRGKVTEEDLFQVFPFDSTPAFIRLTGRELRDLLRMASSGAHGGPVLRGLHLYHGKRGAGIGVEFQIRNGPVTCVGLTQTSDGRFKFVVAEGESLAGPIPATGNTNTRCRFPPDVSGFIENWSLEGPTHHFALGVGHIAHLIADLGRCWGIECVNVTDPGYRRAQYIR